MDGWFRDGRPVAPAAALGFLPCGTGSDLARTLGLPRDPEAAAAALGRAAPRPMDVGRFRSMDPGGAPREGYFVNNLGFGIGGEVAAIANATRKRLPGFAVFFIATLRAFQRYRDRAVRLTLDGATFRDARVTLCSICNGRTAGGGMVLGPDANPFDGWLDLMLLERMRLHDFLGRVRYLYGGRPLADPRIGRRRIRTLRAESIDKRPVSITVDGEDGGRLPLEVEVMPGAIRVLL